MKKVFLSVFVFIYLAFCVTVIAQSNFKELIFKNGIKVKIPKNWIIMTNNLMDQLDTNTEILSGVKQGNNEILIAANCYTHSNKQASATMRLSVRYSRSPSQAQMLNMTDDDIALGNYSGRLATEKTLKKLSPNTKLISYSTSLDSINGLVTLKTEFVTSANEKTLLYIIPLESKRIKLHFTYNLREKSYLLPTIQYIKKSLIISF